MGLITDDTLQKKISEFEMKQQELTKLKSREKDDKKK